MLYSMLLGVINCFLPEHDTFMDVFVAVPQLALVMVWCDTDAKQRGTPLGRWFRLALILLLGVALPWYLMRSRGIRGLITVVAAITFGVALWLLEQAAQIVTLQIGESMGLWEYVL